MITCAGFLRCVLTNPRKSFHGDTSWTNVIWYGVGMGHDEITHVVFTLSQWGSLRLQIQQLPHEYLFVREYLPLVLQKHDIHLIGEFVECLRIFGVAENDSLITSGVRFLLESQNEDGSWDNQMTQFDVDLAYVAYHATIVSVQALAPLLFSGFGCMSEKTEAIVARWYASEVETGKSIECSSCEASRFHCQHRIDKRKKKMKMKTKNKKKKEKG